MRSEARGVAVAALSALALTAPFIGKPFHVDDDVYLKGALQILRDPLHPLGGTQRIFGEVMPTYHFTQHPPLVSYYIALVRLAWGTMDEGALHAAFLVFPVGVAVAMYFLARRFTGAPLLATVLLLGTPAFMVTAHGIMTDIPFLALCLGAVATFVYGVDGRRTWLLAGSAGLLTVACFVQYRGAILPVLLLGYVWARRRMLWAGVLTALPALVSLLCWSIYTRRDLGVVHALDAGSWIGFQPSRFVGDGAAYLGLLGGATVSPLFLLYAAGLSLRREAWLLAGCLTAVATVAVTSGFGLVDRALYACVCAAGIGTVLAVAWSGASLRGTRADAAPEARELARDDLFLLVMFAVPLLSQVTLNIFASARSLLLGLPFAVLLVVRTLERARPGRAVAALGLGVALTAAQGLTLALADLRFAEAEREVARAAAAARPADGAAWFTGEWGFRHYLEKEGFVAWAKGDPVAAGDVFVYPDVASPADLPRSLVERFRLAGMLASASRFPIKVMSFQAHAGFYSNFWGPLPFGVSREPLERVRVFRVGEATR